MLHERTSCPSGLLLAPTPLAQRRRHQEQQQHERQQRMPSVLQSGTSEQLSSWFAQRVLRQRQPHQQDQPEQQQQAGSGAQQSFKFSALTFNLLADQYARHFRSSLYRDVPSRAMAWAHRQELLLAELLHWHPDVACLQEVEHFAALQAALAKEGYEGLWLGRGGRRRDGCATFWQRERLQLLEAVEVRFAELALEDNVALLVRLQPLPMQQPAGSSAAEQALEAAKEQVEATAAATGQASAAPLLGGVLTPGAPAPQLVVGNTHVCFDPAKGHIKLGQIRTLMETAHRLSSPHRALVLLGGDFNLAPHSPLYLFKAQGQLDVGAHCRKQMSGQAKGWGYHDYFSALRQHHARVRTGANPNLTLAHPLPSQRLTSNAAVTPAAPAPAAAAGSLASSPARPQQRHPLHQHKQPDEPHPNATRRVLAKAASAPRGESLRPAHAARSVLAGGWGSLVQSMAAPLFTTATTSAAAPPTASPSAPHTGSSAPRQAAPAAGTGELHPFADQRRFRHAAEPLQQQQEEEEEEVEAGRVRVVPPQLSQATAQDQPDVDLAGDQPDVDPWLLRAECQQEPRRRWRRSLTGGGGNVTAGLSGLRCALRSLLSSSTARAPSTLNLGCHAEPPPSSQHCGAGGTSAAGGGAAAGIGQAGGGLMHGSSLLGASAKSASAGGGLVHDGSLLGASAGIAIAGSSSHTCQAVPNAVDLAPSGHRLPGSLLGGDPPRPGVIGGAGVGWATGAGVEGVGLGVGLGVGQDGSGWTARAGVEGAGGMKVWPLTTAPDLQGYPVTLSQQGVPQPPPPLPPSCPVNPLAAGTGAAALTAATAAEGVAARVSGVKEAGEACPSGASVTCQEAPLQAAAQPCACHARTAPAAAQALSTPPAHAWPMPPPAPAPPAKHAPAPGATARAGAATAVMAPLLPAARSYDKALSYSVGVNGWGKGALRAALGGEAAGQVLRLTKHEQRQQGGGVRAQVGGGGASSSPNPSLAGCLRECVHSVTSWWGTLLRLAVSLPGGGGGDAAAAPQAITARAAAAGGGVAAAGGEAVEGVEPSLCHGGRPASAPSHAVVVVAVAAAHDMLEATAPVVVGDQGTGSAAASPTPRGLEAGQDQRDGGRVAPRGLTMGAPLPAVASWLHAEAAAGPLQWHTGARQAGQVQPSAGGVVTGQLRAASEPPMVQPPTAAAHGPGGALALIAGGPAAAAASGVHAAGGGAGGDAGSGAGVVRAVATHPLRVLSTYVDVLGQEPAFTSTHRGYHGCCDYLWFSPEPVQPASSPHEPSQQQRVRLIPTAVLVPPPMLLLPHGLPALGWGSDHIPLLAHYTLQWQ